MMTFLSRFFNKLIRKDRIDCVENEEALRLEFKSRYHSFKLLLHANNRALEKMAEMEKALQGSDAFGMQFVKANSTSVCVEVFRMIRNLNELTSGKYDELEDRFQKIEKKVASTLSPDCKTGDERLTIPFDQVEKTSYPLTGWKMARLGEIRNRTCLRVPEGFVITSTAFQKFFDHNQLQVEIDRRFQSADFTNLETLERICGEIRKIIINSEVQGELVAAIESAREELERKEPGLLNLALRSSALGEDQSGHSFAGQYCSRLNVKKEELLPAYKEVVAGKYSLSAVTYRYIHGLKDDDDLMSVGCMMMIDAESGGVTYSRNPLNILDDSLTINSSRGLPRSVVDGTTSVDRIEVFRENLQEGHSHDSGEKMKYRIRFPDKSTGDNGLEKSAESLLSLDKQQILELADMAILLEAHFSAPQDIEWAVSRDQKIYCLQSRPLSQVDSKRRPVEVVETPQRGVIKLQGGESGSSGCAVGSVCIVNKNDDALKFPSGSVLVTKQALPKWAPLLSQAVGLITEQGSFAGHLANIAREYGVPAVFNLEGATSLLDNGELITLDADQCRIFEGRLEGLPTKVKRKVSLMAGSPVWNTLDEACRMIVPLNLINPDSADFRPASCRTLHDITRFIHENSVTEMFNFGNEHAFSERSSKQLVYKVPMQWWILNLDDGFKEEVRGKRVQLENIVSIPMRALWSGIVAVPWEGPPPIDGRGFMSVMFQATTNTALNTGTRSRYNEKNYFMITKNFCSLTSRLGFHYSTIEAMITDKTEENYISFQFKGGAADSRRRIKRVQFLGDILEEHDFSIKIKEDILVARLENRDSDDIISHLRILGYLTIHTRQLDMIMSNQSVVRFYKKKLVQDIASIVSQASTLEESLDA
jgi:pyruvate, water dikinase